jgi:hypothetical protein
MSAAPDMGTALAPVPGLAVSLPRPGGRFTLEEMEAKEQAIIEHLPEWTDIRWIEDLRDQAAAWEQYLRKRAAHLPILGAQRRLEARIGQLIGPAPGQGARTDRTCQHDDKSALHRQDQSDFRILARALDGKCELSDDEWRQSRRLLVDLIRARTPRDEPAMRVAEPEAPAMAPVRGVRINLPAGLSAEDACRKAMALEETGLSPAEAASTVGIGKGVTYLRMRDVVMLADRDGLSAPDAAVVARARDVMNETAQVGQAWAMVEPVARRVWGGDARGGPKRDAERRRLEKFDHAFAMLITVCDSAASMDIPYLSRERAAAAAGEVDAAMDHLRTLGNRIRELHP